MTAARCAPPLEAAGTCAAAATACSELAQATDPRIEVLISTDYGCAQNALPHRSSRNHGIDRADRLETTATNFAKSSTRLRQKHRWEQIKGSIYGGAAVCIVLYLVAAKYCGGASLPICRGIVSVLEDGFEAV